jgi:hypothetical protein
MSQTVTVRVPDDTAAWLKSAARRAGRSVSELGAGLFEEARRASEFSQIEFRTFQGERHACLAGGLRLWKLILTAQDYDMNAERTAAHFDMPVWKVQAAFRYYEAFPDEIDAPIRELRSMTFEELRRRLPQIEKIEIDLSGSDETPE